MILHDLVKCFAPVACVFCDEEMTVNTKVPVCDKCKSKIPYVTEPACEICGIPLPEEYNDIYCGRCKKTKFAFERNISQYMYKGIVAESLKRMKFEKHQNWIAEILGVFLADVIEEKYDGINFDCILYVPISAKRLKNRGYNQSEIMAKAISLKLGIKMFDDVLFKIKDTPKQSTISSAKDKKKNVSGAFEVYNHNRVVDKTVLLIDDIITTGSTLNECARLIKKSGATIVYTATSAITGIN